jgi:small subunit ribosomal protein S16
MAVKIRMTRIGRRHKPFFRINIIDSRTPRDGKIIEKVGHYDPIEKDPEKQLVLNTQRVQFWLDKGAIPSDAVSQLLLRLGIKHKYAQEKQTRRAKAKAIARKKGKFFTKAEKITAEKKAQAQVKEAEAQAKAAEEKAKPEEQAKELEAKETEEKVEAETKEEKPAKEQTKIGDEAKEEAKEEKVPEEPEKTEEVKTEAPETQGKEEAKEENASKEEKTE